MHHKETTVLSLEVASLVYEETLRQILQMIKYWRSHCDKKKKHYFFSFLIMSVISTVL